METYDFAKGTLGSQSSMRVALGIHDQTETPILVFFRTFIHLHAFAPKQLQRSEERRVGKECRL